MNCYFTDKPHQGFLILHAITECSLWTAVSMEPDFARASSFNFSDPTNIHKREKGVKYLNSNHLFCR